MRSFLLFPLILCCALFGSHVFSQEASSDVAGSVVVVKVTSDDLQTSRQVREWEQLLNKAEENKAKALIFDLNVKGYLTWDLQERILESLSELKIPTIAFVNSSATGAGSLIAVGSKKIYLSPGGIIGGAGVRLTDVDNEEVQRRDMAQQLSLLKARARSLAKINNHRVDVVEAFIDSEVELKIGETVISKEGEILTLTADEASRSFEGNPLIGNGIANSIDALLRKENLDKEKVLNFTPQEFTRLLNRERLGDVKKEDETTEDTDEEKDPGLFSRDTGQNYKGKIVVLEVGQDALSTGEARFQFMDRVLKKAELDGAEAVIFDIDTPGGYAWYTQGLILNSLQDVTIPTFSFVNTRALSAGAIVAIGTDGIYMRRAASIGSALVVSGTGGDLPEAMNDKVTSMMISVVRNIAELKGHNPDIAEAFVTADKKVQVGRTVIHEGKGVLNLDTLRATEVINGRPVLAKGVANSIEDIVKKEELKGEVMKAQTLGMENFAHWVQKYSAILIILGMAGIYLEMKTPGFALPGLIGLGSFALYFFGNHVAGTLAGYELAVLFVLGLVLIAIEIFLFPGLMIPSLIGGILVISSLGLAMVDRVELQWKWDDMPGAESYAGLIKNSFITLGLGFCGGVILILLLMKYVPKTRFGNLLILNEAVPAGANIDGQIDTTSETRERVSYIGWEGDAVTDLRPDGKARLNGKLMDVVTNGEFIPKGSLVAVNRHEGSRIVVRKIN